MTFSKLGAALFAGALSLAALPACASPVTDAFMANVGANIGFLSQSSQLVADSSAKPALRSFARSELAEQVQVASAFVRLAPSEVASNDTTSASDEVATGRSVAVDRSSSIKETPEQARPAATLTAANGRQALGPADLDQLKKLSGRALEDLYWQKQLDALSQLESDYRTYIASGDDPALVALAKADLPRVMKRLEALTKI